ncbi:AAEL002164-PA [Aedes aegypti]|uniref:AAEL002164-PA n=1 Tax=Aedes aegypti TaxID=7159 RepID=Q17J24_AEDAE|nr:AAEL002164-PA [Aedes aegypti]
MVNLNELESEERDIESFKRFNYYFDPPKTKPKINLNVKDIVVANKKSPVPSSTGSCNADGSNNGSGGGGSRSSSSSNDNNPGGVSIGEDIQPIRPQAPIGTPSQKGLHQQQTTPVSSVGTGVSTMLYPATSDSPASSASIFDGISSSMSSHAHSCDDLYNDLLSSTGNLSLNLNLNLTQLQQSNSDPIVYDSVGFGAVGSTGGPHSLGSVGSASSVAASGKPSTAELAQSIISN